MEINEPIPSPFSDLNAVTPEKLKNCHEFLESAWILTKTMREMDEALGRVYAVQDKIIVHYNRVE